MRTVHSIAALAVSATLAALIHAAAKPSLTLPAKAPTVARNLTIAMSLKLSDPAPDEGLDVTITSDEPRRLLFLRTPQSEPAKSITVKVGQHYFETPTFYVQGLDDKGAAAYTATAPGYTGAKGTIKLGRSAILVLAPQRAP